MVKEFYKGIQYNCSDEYSNKDMTGWDLTDREDMNNTIIHGTCFSRETPHSKVFPPTMTGTTFLFCNLTNIDVPEGNIIDESCSNEQVM